MRSGIQAFTGFVLVALGVGSAQARLDHGIAQVEAGGTHACAVLADHQVVCWGANDRGQLGDGSNTGSATPVVVRGLPPSQTVVAGFAHTCALLLDRTVMCWGANGHGQLGDNSESDSTTPRKVWDLDDAVAITAGYAFTCAIKADSTAACWGDGEAYQVGTGGYGEYVTPRLAVITNPDGSKTPLKGIVALATGDNHACAVLQDTTAACWGLNNFGQDSSGNSALFIKSPATVVIENTDGTTTPLSGVTSITAGRAHTCALLANGTGACWGSNKNGELANGKTDSGATGSPQTIVVTEDDGSTSALTGIAAIAAGSRFTNPSGNDSSNHTCALLANTTVACWGANQAGQLGNGTLSDSASPTTVLSDVDTSLPLVLGAQITTGGWFSCALIAYSSVQCWGANDAGQLGTTTVSFFPTPLTVPIDAPLFYSGFDD